jgi:hypothetical protein
VRIESGSWRDVYWVRSFRQRAHYRGLLCTSRRATASATGRILNFSTPSDWRTAVRVLEDRLNARFFDAAEAIDQQDFAGFAVLALDCLLIETLQQFKDGVDETPRRKGEQYFVNFLTTAPLSSYFTKASAAEFYCHFLCAAFFIRPKSKRGQKFGVSGRSWLPPLMAKGQLSIESYFTPRFEKHSLRTSVLSVIAAMRCYANTSPRK